ncbi:hypothetical protein SAMD00019534_058470 [Acytostelium subglobosum LB1]|uniref:hypothetical protein n=1 Tax=Acytostelium subglobosum LB1 TaxID=1410327 RepID=UPI000644A00C|nr:hypothetical protein SAMD00019534_058470 [Acytostelium subglobosum LB1]GAM22672.1 hypothetical protein SAMD00019534_058470 [Acytostelium subglobosum LB1]|eukprot:XP_012754792.1 hypothetical protein SAMD00019534_058470 [Acytostelium subglobosum LB1]
MRKQFKGSRSGHHHYLQRLRSKLLTALYSNTHGVAAAFTIQNNIIQVNPSLTRQSKSSIYYHRKKLSAQGTYHPLLHGGKRYSLLDDVRFEQLKDFLHRYILEAQPESLKEIVDHVNTQVEDIQFSRSYIRNVISEHLMFSWKVPITVQHQKFTLENLERYVYFCHWISQVDLDSVYWLDESTFESKKCWKRKLLAPRGRVQPIRVNRESFRESFSLMAMISINHGSYARMKDHTEGDTNNSITFCSFIINAMEADYIRPNTYIVLDNASIHTQRDRLPLIQEMLDLINVKLVFLPTYSPELNIIELLFAMMKRECRDKNRTASFLDTIKNAFNKYSSDPTTILNWCHKCYNR